MKRIHAPMAGAMVLALAACGSSSSSSGDDDVVINSVGLLELALPEDGDLDAYEQPFLQDRADAIRMINEGVTEAATALPNASYVGNLTIGIDDGAETLATGQARLNVNLDGSAISGDFDLSTTYRPGEFSEHVFVPLVMASTPLTAGRYSGSLTGGGNIDGGGVSNTVTVDGTVTGAFADSITTIGALRGEITNEDTTVDAFYGVFEATTSVP